MKLLEINKNQVGEIIVKIEEIVSTFLGIKRKIIRSYAADHEFPRGYWNWTELPNHLVVLDQNLKLQLNFWCRRFKSKIVIEDEFIIPTVPDKLRRQDAKIVIDYVDQMGEGYILDLFQMPLIDLETFILGAPSNHIALRVLKLRKDDY